MAAASRRQQRGASLIEALMAFLVLSLGLVGMSKLQGQLRLNADVARQRGEAVRLAQEDIETLRSFSSIAPAAGRRAYADIAAAGSSIGSTPGQPLNTRFQLQRNVSDAEGFRTANVTVGWTDRAGESQQVTLQSVIAAMPPALSGALAVHGDVQPLKPVHGRSARIPVGATRLGDGTSAWKPVSSGSTVLVFDDVSGLVTESCFAGGVSTPALTRASLTSCTDLRGGLLLGGIVRRSTAARAEAAHANDPPLALGVDLTMHGGTYPAAPICFSEARAEHNDRFVAYHCIVTPLLGRWSGRSTLVPQGWSLGTGAADHKVCRYSADQDGSGAVDHNAEHPDSYLNVDRPLMQQNFLVIPGDRPCPTANTPATVSANQSTVQHQP